MLYLTIQSLPIEMSSIRSCFVSDTIQFCTNILDMAVFSGKDEEDVL